jgi:AraC-like DNA-binding protein
MANDRIAYESALCTIGRFRCLPGDPDWRADNHTAAALFVFPTVPVEIERAGRDPVIADRNQIMFYNRRQPYRRRQLCDHGDEATWFAPNTDVLIEVMSAFEPSVQDRPEHPFRFVHGPGPAEAYALHRALCHGIETERVDPLEVEETCVALLEQAIASAFAFNGKRPRPRRPSTAAAHRDIVNAAQTLLATAPDHRWTLKELARQTYTSVYHFCRVFRGATDMSAYHYLTQLRLRMALDRLVDDDLEVSALAMELGFGSHSHFTDTFRGAFGLAPSRFRELARQRGAREMGRILEARGGGAHDPWS